MKHLLTRTLFACLLAALTQPALSQTDPGSFYRTGRLQDKTTGANVVGVRNVTVRFYDGADSSDAIISKSIALEFVDGYFTLKLPYDVELLSFFTERQ